MEDATSRVELDIPMDMTDKFFTGVVVAMRGTPTQDGKLKVTGVCLARPPPVTTLHPAPSTGENPGAFLALLSGLQFGVLGVDVAARERALEFILGHGKEDTAHLGEAVQWVIVCGGTFGIDRQACDMSASLEEADDFFTRLASVVHVDVMPSRNDPSNISLPQMPMHKYLFRNACACTEFRSVSNPYECNLSGMHILGHSGEPVKDMLRCTKLGSPLEALTTTLQALHIAPTAPDTLEAQPCNTQLDPFVINNMPHVLFSGGHNRADQEWRAQRYGEGGTMCVCVPSFHLQPALTLVNLHDPRDVRVVEFHSPM